MGAVAYTLVRATPHQLVYSFTGDGAGTLAYATFAANAVAGPLSTAIAACAGQCDSNAKATSALIYGASFVGAISAAAIITNIQTRITLTLTTTIKFTPGLTAVDDGGTNNPALVLTPEAASTGFLYITHRWSPTV